MCWRRGVSALPALPEQAEAAESEEAERGRLGDAHAPAEGPVVEKFDLSAMGFMTIVLGGPIGPRELSDFAEHGVKERLERIPGVGGIRTYGAREREVRIWLDPLRLSGYGLAIGWFVSMTIGS